ncbi:hypothetical protein ACFQT0_09860 [Hymenobacter humi]|uniref:Uncharacterized protein n=1 Tax=Hymenobacter humi TaxID=1411620 RepID=A0ABW2U5L1_9BACT
MCVLLAGGLIAFDILTQDPLKPGLCFAASREASLGGLWLGLYRDGTFAFGQHERAIAARGTYRFRGDTLLLAAAPGTSITRDRPHYRFLLRDSLLEELLEPTEDVRIGFLEVHRTGHGSCVPALSANPPTAGKATSPAPGPKQEVVHRNGGALNALRLVKGTILSCGNG